MQTSSETTIYTIILSSFIIIFFGLAVIYILFAYQRKKFRHQREMLEMREAFGQTLLKSKLAIQEQTLDHISKELHANVSHLASLININLAEILPQTTDGTRENVIETKGLVKQLMAELKGLSASLNTGHNLHIGLGKALENEFHRIGKKYEITITKTGEEYRLKPDHEIILFRLCQEVLNNVIKYSEASKIILSLSYSPDNLLLSISDNGQGFDIEKVMELSAEKQSTGLLNMKERASQINGVLSISSVPGEGTTVTIEISHPDKLNQLAA
ncbi:MAG: hypothetical protein DI535_14295 [Citrobacter freundii]|nr:MAG: hypothetical protein DI535_14295 [Citrobacter freundii]